MKGVLTVNRLRFSTSKPLPIVSRLLLTLPLMTLAVVVCGARTITTAALPHQTASWVEVEPPEEGFSVQMPKGYTQEPFEMPNVRLSGRTYRATFGLLRFAVSSINSARMSGNAQRRLASFTAEYEKALPTYADDRGAKMSFERELDVGGFVGRQYQITSANMRGLVRVYATGRKVFVVEVLGGTESSLAATRFLNSFRITEQRTEVSDEQSDETDGPSGRRRRNRGADSRGQEDLTDDTGNGLLTSLETCACGIDPEQEFKDGRITRKAILCPLPPLEGTKEADRHRFSGVVKLRLELNASGLITNVEIIQPQPYGLTEKAMEMARQIKFCPALQSGVPVTSYLDLDCEYQFRVIRVPTPKKSTRRRP